MRGLFALCAILAPTGLAGQQVEVTLDEAIERALRVQPAIVQARGDEANAGAQKRAAYGAFLPSLEVTSNAFRQNIASFVGGFPVEAGDYQYSSGLTARLDLFTGFRRLARRANAAASQDAAAAGVLNEQFQVTLATKQLFYDALAREDLVGVAEAQVRRAEQQLQISVEKLRAGAATRSDSLRSTVEYGNARIALLQARANLATAQANLGRQVGAEGPVRATADSGLPEFPDTTALRTLGVDRSPAVERAEALARAATASVWDSRSPYFPTLNVSLNTSSQGLNQPWEGFDSNRNQNRLTFALSWTLFNGFQREQTLAAAQVTRDLRRSQADDARRQASAQLTQYMAALATAFEQIDIARSTVAAAAEDLRVQSERYRVGASTILDLLTSQAALTQAEVGLVQARFDYLIARAQLEALVGRAL